MVYLNMNFQEKMEECFDKFSQSMDDTEGGLEALIQVVDCKNVSFMYRLTDK